MELVRVSLKEAAFTCTTKAAAAVSPVVAFGSGCAIDLRLGASIAEYIYYLERLLMKVVVVVVVVGAIECKLYQRQSQMGRRRRIVALDGPHQIIRGELAAAASTADRRARRGRHAPAVLCSASPRPARAAILPW